ncbi:MAG: flagellar motor switch protein FliM [Candidatus Hydrogenedentes bacterium]|nr:flagellar motor switch protein FliM [Candidatus Hydrogenedentota bacterium]
MADILSQDEVDTLLAAVSEGDIDEDLPVQASGDQHLLTTYDFRRPERVSKEQLKGLQSLFEAFAREISIVLPSFLRTVVRVDLASIDQLTYDEFILSVARPTSISIIDMSPLDGKSILEMNPGMVFPIVDRVLGGKGVSLSAPRELTEIENRIVYRIVLMILDSWTRAWEQLIELDMSVVNQENDPLIVQIVAGSEMVILVGYEIHIGDTVGSMNMCVPLLVLNPILDKISQQTHFQRKMSSAAASMTRKMLTDTVNESSIPVEPILGETKMLLSEIANLQIGDVIALDSNHDEPIPVKVGGKLRFRAKPGRKGEQSSVQLVSVMHE